MDSSDPAVGAPQWRLYGDGYYGAEDDVLQVEPHAETEEDVRALEELGRQVMAELGPGVAAVTFQLAHRGTWLDQWAGEEVGEELDAGRWTLTALGDDRLGSAPRSLRLADTDTVPDAGAWRRELEHDLAAGQRRRDGRSWRGGTRP